MAHQPTITSTANTAIKAAKALRLRKRRTETGQFLVEGARTVADAVGRGHAPRELFVLDTWADGEGCEAVARYLAAGARCHRVSAKVIESLSGQANPQPLLAVFDQRWTPLDEAPLTDDTLWVALEGIRDPGNLGTILRTSAAVGGTGVILLGAACDPFGPECVRASMGAIFAQRLVRSTVSEASAWARGGGAMVVATSPHEGRPYGEVDYRLPLVALLGAEDSGLSEPAQAACDALARIPMSGKVESLNIAVSTAVLLYGIVGRLGIIGAR